MHAPNAPALRLLALAGPLGCLLVLAAWFDLAPGGWKLHGLFEWSGTRAARTSQLHALARLEEFEAARGAPERDAVLLLGSSTIERFPVEDCFPGKRVLNRGIAEARLELFERVFERCLPRSTPSGVVLYAGSLELREGREPFARATERLHGLVSELRVRYGPALPITLLGLLPARRQDEAAARALAAANEDLRRLARDDALSFLPLARPPLAGPDGALAEGLSSDDLHLNAEGYRILARWLCEEGGEAGRKLAP